MSLWNQHEKDEYIYGISIKKFINSIKPKQSSTQKSTFITLLSEFLITEWGLTMSVNLITVS